MRTRVALMTMLLLSLMMSITHAQQPAPVDVLVPEVLNVYPHDNDAFTQGLIWHEGSLYESTGQRGESSLRKVEIETGDVQQQLNVTRPEGAGEDVPLYFAEGLELVNGRLIQLTWTAGDALVYDLASFEQVDLYEYDGEGWGLCYDDRYLFMSDGSSYISVRDPETFDLIVRFAVTLEGQVLQSGLLNELECVGDEIYANLWQTDYIARLDKFTGQITALIDAGDLLTEEERAALASGQVLNGIAYNPEDETFFITGKDWSSMFEVRFVPAPPVEAG
jgi:glutamine cyclotransferase